MQRLERILDILLRKTSGHLQGSLAPHPAMRVRKPDNHIGHLQGGLGSSPRHEGSRAEYDDGCKLESETVGR
jgi:hypothetical protein